MAFYSYYEANKTIFTIALNNIAICPCYANLTQLKEKCLFIMTNGILLFRKMAWYLYFNPYNLGVIEIIKFCSVYPLYNFFLIYVF